MSDEVSLKFLFANHDGVSVTLTVADSMVVSELKETLLKNWPEEKVQKPANPAGIRLLTMGRMLEDARTLAEMKIPKYEHPTPINVSLLPGGKSYSENATSNSIAWVKKVDGNGQGVPNRHADGGCCTIG